MAAHLIILGANGQVGQALTKLAPGAGFDPLCFGSADVNLADLSALATLAADHPGVPVINAAAYTAVDKAETDPETAYAVNGVGPAWLGALFGQDRPLIHFSTDYVFAGTGETAFAETDPTAPLGVYGLSKRMGEMGVLAAPHGTVIRTAWVYGETGNNFLKTMLRVGQARGALSVVDDQIGTPTHADDIAAGALALLARQQAGDADTGLYHLTAQGQTSWHGFAAAIFEALQDQTGVQVGLTAIPTSAYPTPAQRPSFSVLNCSRIDAATSIERPHWKDRIAATVADVLAQEKEAS